MPSALSLAVLAALLEFIPFLGPIIAALPAVLLAFAAGSDKGFWTVLLFTVIQQLEGNVLERSSSSGLSSCRRSSYSARSGSFGAPLTVVLYILVERLYVREALDTPTAIPGEREARG